MLNPVFTLLTALALSASFLQADGDRAKFDFRYLGESLVTPATLEEAVELPRGGELERLGDGYRLHGAGRLVYKMRLSVERDAEYLFRVRVRSKDQFVCRIGQLSMAYNDLGEWQTVSGLYRNNAASTAEVTLTLAPLESRREASVEINNISMIRVERPVAVTRRSVSGNTPLVTESHPLATIVIPSEPALYREWAERISGAVREKTGVALQVVTDTAATEADYPILKAPYRISHLIVLGRLGNNRAFWPAYNHFYTAVDGHYPGGDGYALHTATNLFHQGNNHLLIGGTSDEGVRRGVERFLKKIEEQPKGVGLTLPWLLEVDLQGECLAFFKADNARWEEVPENAALPKPEPGYGNIIRWYQNAMGYYWTGWDSYRQRADRQFQQVLAEGAITHHYIVEFFIRTYEALHASGVLSPEEIAKADALITSNFLDFLTVSDLGWMTTFAPPYGQINLVNRHQVAPWVGDLKMGELITEVMTPEGGMKELAEFRRWEKERVFRDFAANRSGPNLPGGVTPSACEEIIATFFRFALERDLYREFFESGGAYDALTLERINPVTGQYILPSGIRDTKLLLGIMANLTRSPEMKWLWAHLPESVHVRGHFQGRYLGEVRRYTPDLAWPENQPKEGLGVRVAPNPVRNSPIRATDRDYYFLSYRSDYTRDADYVAFNGVSYSEPAGTLPVLISQGTSWLTGQDGGGRFDLNAVTAVRTDAGRPKPAKRDEPLSQRLWDASNSAGTALRLRQTLTPELIWTRDLIIPQKGLFVFRDEFKAFKPGDYSLNVNWHPIGSGTLEGDRASFIIRDGRFDVTLLGDGFLPQLTGDAGRMAFRNQSLRRMEAGESVVSYTVMEAAKSRQSLFHSAKLSAGGLVLTGPKGETRLDWKPGEWNGFKSDAELIARTPETVAFFQAKTLERQGVPLVSHPKATSFALERTGEWIGVPAEFMGRASHGSGSALFAALSQGETALAKNEGKAVKPTLQIAVEQGAASELWRFDEFLKPAEITSYRRLDDGSIDFGKTVPLVEIRAKSNQPIWKPAPLPEKLSIATERKGDTPDWKPVTGERKWRPGVRTANYGEAHPVEQVDEAVFLNGLPARYVKAEPAAALAFFASDRKTARHPIRIEARDFLGRGTSQVLVVSDVFPQFPRAVRDDDLSVALLDESGGVIFQKDLSGPVQSVRLLDRQGKGEKELFILYANGRLEAFGLDGEGRGSADIYEMHREFNLAEGKGNTRAPAGGYVMPFSMGLWQPDAAGRRKLAIGRYGGFTFLNNDLSFEGVLNISGYATPGMLEQGADFGAGSEEIIVAERLRFWQLGGESKPRVRDRSGSSYWPQVYELLETVPEDEPSRVPLGGMPIRRFELLEKASSTPRYALLARGTSLSLYDGKNRSVAYGWSAPAPILDVALTGQSHGNLSLAVATADGLLWQMRWEQGLEQPPTLKAQRFPDVIHSLREGTGGQVLIGGATGLYVMQPDHRVFRIATGSFQSVAPLGHRIVAADRDGQIHCFQAR